MKLKPRFDCAHRRGVVEASGGGVEAAIIIAEVEIEILGFYCPTRVKHVFKTATNSPAGKCATALVNSIGEVGHSDLAGKERKAAFGIKQRIAINEAAAAGDIAVPASRAGDRQGVRRIAEGKCARAADIHPADVGLDAPKEVAGLEVVPKLDTSEETRGAEGLIRLDGRIGQEYDVVGRIDTRPIGTNVGACIEPCPERNWDCRWRRRSL